MGDSSSNYDINESAAGKSSSIFKNSTKPKVDEIELRKQ